MIRQEGRDNGVSAARDDAVGPMPMRRDTGASSSFFLACKLQPARCPCGGIIWWGQCASESRGQGSSDNLFFYRLILRASPALDSDFI